MLARARVMIVAGGALVWSGCASSPGGQPNAPVSLEITNHHRLDVHAYVVAGGQRHSLGLVTSNQTVQITLPERIRSPNQRYQFLALPIGSGASFTSEELFLEPGDEVVWIINNRLIQSSVSIR